MNCIILAAGRGVRTRSITDQYGLGFPKGLLPLKNKSIIDHLLQQLPKLYGSKIQKIALVANAGSTPHFKNHLDKFYPFIDLVNNNVADHSQRKGAIGDLIWTAQKLSLMDQPLLILPSDTLAKINLEHLIDQYWLLQKKHKNTNQIDQKINIITGCALKDKNIIKDTLGCMELDDENYLTNFEEKPHYPKTNITSVPIYCYTPHTLNLISQYAQQQNLENNLAGLDSPGMVIPWLIDKTQIKVYLIEDYQDVGLPETFLMLQKQKS